MNYHAGVGIRVDDSICQGVWIHWDHRTANRHYLGNKCYDHACISLSDSPKLYTYKSSGKALLLVRPPFRIMSLGLLLASILPKDINFHHNVPLKVLLVPEDSQQLSTFSKEKQQRFLANRYSENNRGYLELWTTRWWKPIRCIWVSSQSSLTVWRAGSFATIAHVNHVNSRTSHGCWVPFRVFWIVYDCKNCKRSMNNQNHTNTTWSVDITEIVRTKKLWIRILLSIWEMCFLSNRCGVTAVCQT